MESVMVDAECIRDTAEKGAYYKAGQTYTIDMAHAMEVGNWKYFRPLREVPEAEVRERIEAARAERASANRDREKELEEEQARLAEREKAETAKGKTVSMSTSSKGK